MADDLHDAIKGLGRQPRSQLDMDQLWARSRRRRFARRATTGVLTAALATVVAVTVPALISGRSPAHVPIVTAIGLEAPSASPYGEGARTPSDGTVWQDWHINGYGMRLSVPDGWSLKPGEATTWQGPNGELAVSAGIKYVIDDDAAIERHCRDEAANHPVLVDGITVDILTIAGQPACLVSSPTNQSFVAVVRFPPEANASNTTDVVLVGHGLDARHVLDGLRFDDGPRQAP